jgi:transposase
MTEEGFFCEEDALKTVEKWIQYFLSVVLNNVDLIAIRRHESGKRDRSSKDEKLKTYYRINEIIKTNETLVLKN